MVKVRLLILVELLSYRSTLGMHGVSLLLIETSLPGVTTRRLECQGVLSSGTTYVLLEDVRVPVINLIGEENQGFKYASSS